jgi:putative endonuclease
MKRKVKSSRKPFTRSGSFFVYIVQCADGTYYTGYTNNLENRIALHKSGKGAKYVKYKLPAKLVYVKEYRYYKLAFNEEKRVKTLKREQKSELIRVYAENKSAVEKKRSFRGKP